jgi:hypothetical protein
MTDAFAHAPLDEIDDAILDQIRSAYALADPLPADLNDRVCFAIGLESAEVEIARLQDDLLVGSGARGGERTRTMTFDAERLTILVSIVELPDGLVRLDGWLAPPAPLRVELRLSEPATSRLVTADDSGRFVFADVGRGLVQLLVHPVPGVGDGPATSVVTQAWTL